MSKLFLRSLILCVLVSLFAAAEFETEEQIPDQPSGKLSLLDAHNVDLYSVWPEDTATLSQLKLKCIFFLFSSPVYIWLANIDVKNVQLCWLFSLFIG